jgi:hypothetical protein
MPRGPKGNHRPSRPQARKSTLRLNQIADLRGQFVYSGAFSGQPSERSAVLDFLAEIRRALLVRRDIRNH